MCLSISFHGLTPLTRQVVLRGAFVTPSRSVKVCRDPDDDMVIEAALAGMAEYIVTGDKDLLTLKEFESVRFITPRVFLAMF